MSKLLPFLLKPYTLRYWQESWQASLLEQCLSNRFHKANQPTQHELIPFHPGMGYLFCNLSSSLQIKTLSPLPRWSIRALQKRYKKSQYNIGLEAFCRNALLDNAFDEIVCNPEIINAYTSLRIPQNSLHSLSFLMFPSILSFQHVKDSLYAQTRQQ